MRRSLLTPPSAGERLIVGVEPTLASAQSGFDADARSYGYAAGAATETGTLTKVRMHIRQRVAARPIAFVINPSTGVIRSVSGPIAGAGTGIFTYDVALAIVAGDRLGVGFGDSSGNGSDAIGYFTTAGNQRITFAGVPVAGAAPSLSLMGAGHLSLAGYMA